MKGVVRSISSQVTNYRGAVLIKWKGKPILELIVLWRVMFLFLFVIQSCFVFKCFLSLVFLFSSFIVFSLCCFLLPYLELSYFLVRWQRNSLHLLSSYKLLHAKLMFWSHYAFLSLIICRFHVSVIFPLCCFLVLRWSLTWVVGAERTPQHTWTYLDLPACVHRTSLRLNRIWKLLQKRNSSRP